MGYRLGRIVVGILLTVTLSACGLWGQGPSQRIVEKAIALQLSQTQQSLSQQLSPLSQTPPSVDVSHIKVHQRQSMQIETHALYRVTGHCDLQIAFPDRRITEKSTPFEVYLQPGSSQGTWLLTRPESSTESGMSPATWETVPIDNA